MFGQCTGECRRSGELWCTPMPHHGFFGHKRNASFAQTLTPQCRTAWLRHRHEGGDIIKLNRQPGPQPGSIKMQNSRTEIGNREMQSKTEAAAEYKHTSWRRKATWSPVTSGKEDRTEARSNSHHFLRRYFKKLGGKKA